MDNLLDTHTFIWFINGDKQLSNKARESIENGINYISVASLWEISIKVSLQKLQLNTPYSNVIEQIIGNNFQLLPITFEDTLTLSTLEFHHRDPFDRILIAQSITNNLSVITRDTNFSKYGADIVW